MAIITGGGRVSLLCVSAKIDSWSNRAACCNRQTMNMETGLLSYGAAWDFSDLDLWMVPLETASLPSQPSKYLITFYKNRSSLFPFGKL